ncbi:2OG-Fe(II) oxygenase [Denitrificimonas sp. JX-1]|uniref:2OG-Fe(II) oxygenase n=1 Tax=Denitrificimonas halotolerans TaxID=3098930 RepID=A0ABU5GT22_9GAMM|nr:2OG-Fe(II) oxygenase [Denitrificimonas sp. JX-1]MDY7220019.1 2OG-Fe(II) oxygenase [Denitrificimonas sp. JX-1]
MNTLAITPLFERIVDDLATKGWSQQAAFTPEDLTAQLAEECRHRAEKGQLEAAGIGRGNAKAVNTGIRGDKIQWLEQGQNTAVDRYLELMEQLRAALNRTLFLGLDELECHFALYSPGAFYKKHVDRFRDDDRRIVTCIAYLNDNWLPEDGGELRIYLEHEHVHEVPPQAGTLVVFMSADLAHEVLPVQRERLSITGWFLRRA